MNRKAAAFLAVVMIAAVASIGIFTEWEDLGTGVDYSDGVPENAIPFVPGDVSRDDIKYIYFGKKRNSYRCRRENSSP